MVYIKRYLLQLRLYSPGSSMAVAVAQRSSPLNRCASGRGELSGGADHGRDARTRSCHTACSDKNLACSSAILESMVSSTTQPSAPCVCSASSSSSCHTQTCVLSMKCTMNCILFEDDPPGTRLLSQGPAHLLHEVIIAVTRNFVSAQDLSIITICFHHAAFYDSMVSGRAAEPGWLTKQRNI